MSEDVRRPSGRVLANRIWPAIAGYELVAPYYDEWYWQAFWEANERPLIVRELERIRCHSSVALDSGTGTGMYLRELARLGAKCVGLDTSQAMLDRARKRLLMPVRLICGSVEQLPFLDGTFDLVTACRVLSHVKDVQRVMQEFGRVTKPGGRLVLSDVSASHNYATTRIPIPDGDVHIETYKHPVQQLVAAAKRCGYWRVEHIESVAYKDLVWRPESAAYPAVDASSERPVFFYGVLRRLTARSKGS